MPVTRSQTLRLKAAPYVTRPTLVIPRPQSPAYSPTSPAYRPTSPNPLWGYSTPCTPEPGGTPLYDPTATPGWWNQGTPMGSPYQITSPLPWTPTSPTPRYVPTSPLYQVTSPRPTFASLNYAALRNVIEYAKCYEGTSATPFHGLLLEAASMSSEMVAGILNGEDVV